MDTRKVIRSEYVCCLREDMPIDSGLFAICRKNALSIINEGRAMTAAVYVYKRRLFAYTEGLDTELRPEDFCGELKDYILPVSGLRHITSRPLQTRSRFGFRPPSP